jgi:DNA-binding CsgD family transcriptional regulator
LRQNANLSEELALNDYRQFCTICNARLMGIADKLDRRGLTEREIRICVLVLIGLSYTEIAAVLYRAESGIGKDKYLIAKRLGVRTKDLQHTLREIAEEP